MGPAVLLPRQQAKLARGAKDKEHAMSQTPNTAIVVGHDARGAIVLRQKARLAHIPPCLIGMEACVGAHHLSRKAADWRGRAAVNARPCRRVASHRNAQTAGQRDEVVLRVPVLRHPQTRVLVGPRTRTLHSWQVVKAQRRACPAAARAAARRIAARILVPRDRTSVAGASHRS
jgi:hypothetical protein